MMIQTHKQLILARRRMLRRLIAAAVAMFLSAQTQDLAAAEGIAGRPLNVVLIFADDK